MKQRNCQVNPVKMSVRRTGTIVAQAVVLLLFSTGLWSCSVLQDRYLFPTKTSLELAGAEQNIRLQKFSEEFLPEAVGVHHLGSKQQEIKMMKGDVSAALFSRVANRLAEKRLRPRLEDEVVWDLTIAGLGTQNDDVYLGGIIRKFSVQASTVTARVKTEYEFTVEVDCYIGRGGEKKVTKRTVRYVQKVLSISHSQRAMEGLLDKFLEEAALQVVENIQSFLE